VPELEKYLYGKSEIGTYLFNIVRSYERAGSYAWSKVIWDIAAIAYLNNPEFVPTDIVSSPILNDNMTWSVDHSRHFIRTATYVHRDKIFADLFKKLTETNIDIERG
jgi:hypothetical protein